ncbi:MAG: isoleucine--tRNA ligase [Patescibacteria group bacterium]
MAKREQKDSHVSFPEMEQEVLAFWEKENIFKKTLDKTKGGESFVFFEGPPTANGKPGIHHVLARAYKDIMLRYKTMRGFFVERKAGWDTHGLPVELQVEKELGISGKPDIEKYGIAEFNAKCRESVWKYKREWEELTKRIGFWLDLDRPYVTYENDYVESLWWVIKQVWDRGLLYKGHKVVPHCPRCGTALSSHEVAQGYKSVKDNSVYLKFKVLGEDDTYILSWTTTPWTLPGNVALAVGEKIDYVRAKVGKEIFILAQAALGRIAEKCKVIEELKGSALVGTRYEPLFDIAALQSETSHQVYAADFVNTEEGTGVVHTAVMYGEDDYQLGEKVGLPKHHTVDENGKFTDDVPEFAGKFVKDKDVERGIVALLRGRGVLYHEELHEHDYPFCWRCDTPLLYYAKDSWFIRMSELKKELINNNNEINWVPGYIKHGRFGEWLNEVKDWAFSRERYWGTPLPIWESDDGDRICIGSFAELKELAKDPSKVGDRFDPHRPFVDEIEIVRDGKTFRRIKEVADVWFDSGSMPFAQWHYPFENRGRIDDNVSFPAAYIAEAIDQTRGWFYTLLAVSTLLQKSSPYRNVICLGHIMDSTGQKMSKSRGNVVDPFTMVGTYGADALRWHLFTMNQPGDTKLFDEKSLEDVVKKYWLILWNVLSFWKMYAGEFKRTDAYEPPRAPHVLDRWIIARLHELASQVSGKLDRYAVTEAARSIGEFIAELSTWYLRRSRSRFKHAGAVRQDAVAVLHYVLMTLSKLLAPFVPFIAESLYREVMPRGSGAESVHLADWPQADAARIDKKVLKGMATVRQAVELGHSLRKEKKLKVRQPLAQFVVRTKALDPELKELIKEEVNVDEVVAVDELPVYDEFVFKEAPGLAVALDTTITDELRQRGIVREMVRHINAMRKDAKLTIEDTITVYYEITNEELRGIFKHYRERICREVIAVTCLEELPENVDLKTVLEISGNKITFGIKQQ